MLLDYVEIIATRKALRQSGWLNASGATPIN